MSSGKESNSSVSEEELVFSVSEEEPVSESEEESSESEESLGSSGSSEEHSGDSLSMDDEESEEDVYPIGRGRGRGTAKTTTGRGSVSTARGRGTTSRGRGATARGTAKTSTGRGSSTTARGRGTKPAEKTPPKAAPVVVEAEFLDIESEVQKLKKLPGETQTAFAFRKDTFEKILSQGNYDLGESVLYSKMITNFATKASFPADADKKKMEEVMKDCDITL